MFKVVNKRFLQFGRIKYCMNYNYSSTAVQFERWDLLSAVSLERKSIICKDFNDIENQFINYLSSVETESSYKSGHELRFEADIKRAEDIKKGVEVDVDATLQQTAQDYEDSCMEALQNFKFASRVTDEDSTKDLKSLNRLLSHNLLLLINECIGEERVWVLPQGVWQDGESLRETAERVLKEKCGESLAVKFLGNAPCGVYKYRYPRKIRKNDIVGAKIFFFKALYLNGLLECKNDYQWASREELNKLQEDYLRSVNMFLIDEEN